jgi:hypothetical protein
MLTTAAGTACETFEAGAEGWYLYGITLHGPLSSELAEPVQVLDCDGLAAVVRPVLLAEFSQEILQERLRSATQLEAIVRSHNQVVDAVHACQAILPAKFGSVFATAEDVRAALQSTRDLLVPQLHRLEGCDEWAVHLFANRAQLQEGISMGSSVMRRLRDECAAARPGRAYFLGQQLRRELELATEQGMATLAQEAFDRIAEHAVAGQLSRVGPVRSGPDEMEILRASFLVARAGVEQFEEAVHSSAPTTAALRAEYTGPWPPYSFAAWNDEDVE